MDLNAEMISSLVSGLLGGIVGAWRANQRGTQTSLDAGAKAFGELRTENRELRDRLAKLEGKLELSVGLGLIRPSTPEVAKEGA
jgi:hypothetical protein